MEEHDLQLVDLVTDGQVRAIGFDLEIEADHLKYSAWCSALASAGLALIISNQEKVFPTKTLSPYLNAGLIVVVGLALIAAIAIGALVNWTSNREFSRKRQEMTIVLKQRIIVYADNNASATGRELANRIAKREFLGESDKARLEKFERERRKQSDGEKLLLLQQAAVSVAYCVALGSVVARYVTGG